jgi:Terminase small subunit
MPRLTNRVKQFCLFYTNPSSETFSNATKSYLKAGFKSENPHKQSYLLVHREEVKSYLAELESQRLADYNWTRDRYIQEGVDTINELPRSSGVRAKYYEIVGKVKGFFNDNPISNILVYNDEAQNNPDSNTPSIKSRLNKLLCIVSKEKEGHSSPSQ